MPGTSLNHRSIFSIQNFISIFEVQESQFYYQTWPSSVVNTIQEMKLIVKTEDQS